MPAHIRRLEHRYWLQKVWGGYLYPVRGLRSTQHRHGLSHLGTPDASDVGPQTPLQAEAGCLRDFHDWSLVCTSFSMSTVAFLLTVLAASV